jgi:hypothetical protein
VPCAIACQRQYRRADATSGISRLGSWLRSCFALGMLGTRWLIASGLTTFSLVAACGTDSGTSPASSGGDAGVGGAAPATGGRAAQTGGASSAGAGGAAASGGSAGRAATGGSASGGSASGGTASLCPSGQPSGTCGPTTAECWYQGQCYQCSACQNRPPPDVGVSCNWLPADNASCAQPEGEGGSGGGPTGVRCGSKTCGENQYCKAPCSGTLPPEPVMVEPTCTDLPARCIGETSCECICGGTGFCRDGEPEVQCGCA